MPDLRMHSFGFLRWVFRVVEFQTSLGPPRSDILLLEDKHTLRISYAIVITRRNVPAVSIGSLYSSIITVKLQKQIGNNSISECPRIVSRPTPLYKKNFVSLAVLCVVLLPSQFCFQQFSKS